MAGLEGNEIGSYRLIKKIGSGSFGDIYEGEHTKNKTKAAVKVARADLKSEELEQFRKEIRFMSSMNSDHIVSAYGSSIEDNPPYLAMQFAHNGNLLQRHPKGEKVPLDTVVDYVEQIADALQYIHNRNLVNCDIRPEHFLVGEDQKILLCDFSFAIEEADIRAKQFQTQDRRQEYMAPEQMAAEPCPASDQYALAIVVYQWLCGKLPFSISPPTTDEHGIELKNLEYLHRKIVPPPLEGVPIEVGEVVLRALSKSPSNRFPNVTEFANVLKTQAAKVSQADKQNQKDAEAQEGSPVPSPDSTSPTPKTHPETSQKEEPPTSTNTTESVSRTSSSNLLEQHENSRRAFLLTAAKSAPLLLLPFIWLKLEPELSQIRFSGSSTSLPSKTTVLVYYGHTDQVNAITWSPNSRYIASASSDGTVHIWDAITGNRLVTYGNHKNPPVKDVAWLLSNNHNIIASCAGREIHIWDAKNGDMLYPPYRGHNGQVNAVAWSPDTTTMRIASAGSDGKVLVNDLSDQNWNSVPSPPPIKTAIVDVAWSYDGIYIASFSKSQNANVWTWEVETSREAFFPTHDYVRSFAWSTTQQYLVLGFESMPEQGWEVYTDHQRSLSIHRDYFDVVTKIAWSPDSKYIDGKYIASGTENGLVHVWDVTTGKDIYPPYDEHKVGTINALAWSPDGKYIASGGSDHTVRVWTSGLFQQSVYKFS